MEADWSVEIGADVPRIVVPWGEGESGGLHYVDLRSGNDGQIPIEEALHYPALTQALVRLNAADSPAYTSKCDVWPLEADDIDPYEFDTARENAARGLACYIDVLLRDEVAFASFSTQEAWLRALTLELCRQPLHAARVELVLRPAEAFSAEGYAITLYVSACGADTAHAATTWAAALSAAVDTLQTLRPSST